MRSTIAILASPHDAATVCRSFSLCVSLASLLKNMQLSDWEARPLSAAQLQYAALDAHCLVQILHAMSVTVLLLRCCRSWLLFSYTDRRIDWCWWNADRMERPLLTDPDTSSTKPALAANSVRVVDHITRLENTTPVSADVATELTRLRGEYITSWRNELPLRLLTPDDVLRFWELRRTEYEESLSAPQKSDEYADVDLEIHFLSAAAVSELLAQDDVTQQTDSIRSRHFTHINSICFFADGTCCDEVV